MIKTLLEKNPFYILEVLPTEKRSNIIAKVEEKSFFSDDNSYEEAQTQLLNPEKRLSAELDWFCGLSVEKIAYINNCINEAKEISSDGLDGISKLNIVLHNFALSKYNDYFKLGSAILEIDELYSNVDFPNLLSTINNCRQQSGIREVAENELEREYYKKRDQIRQLISEKTANLSNDDYIKFITILAEKYIVDEDYNDGIVISDTIDQYEIKMQSSIEEASDEIYSYIEKIKKLSNDEITDNSITDLINLVQKWDLLAQPLQLKSMASGVTHVGSEKTGQAIRNFSLWLHNERGLSDLSLRLNNAMKPVFVEIRNLFTMFDSDIDDLSTIIRENKEAEPIIKEMDSLREKADSLKNDTSDFQIYEFIDRVKALNEKVQQMNLSNEFIDQIRGNICYIARDLAITLHNEKQQTVRALIIAKMLVAEFGDLSVVKSILPKDVETLQQCIPVQQVQQKKQKQKKEAKLPGWLIVIGILLFIHFIFGGFESSAPKEEYEFSQSANSFDKVYIDIVSIEPKFFIYSNRDFYYTHVVSKCKTKDGNKVWVYMYIDDYHEYIDPDAYFGSTAISDTPKFDVKKFPKSKRLHGTAREAEDLCEGLSSDTNATMILDFDPPDTED